MVKLPQDFSRLENGYKGIVCDLRYASPLNFMNRITDGYRTNNVIITSTALIERLTEAQEDFSKSGYSIVVYDAYRPLSATLDFYKWSQDKNQNGNKELFYPHMDKEELFNKGYVAIKSGHCRGAAIDLTIIDKNTQYNYKPIIEQRKIGNKSIAFINDNTLDMGSSFDLLDELSWTNNNDISSEAKKNRYYLREIMHKYGFQNYAKEWWHFSIKDEPFPNIYFDFEVV